MGMVQKNVRIPSRFIGNAKNVYWRKSQSRKQAFHSNTCLKYCLRIVLDLPGDCSPRKNDFFIKINCKINRNYFCVIRLKSLRILRSFFSYFKTYFILIKLFFFYIFLSANIIFTLFLFSRTKSKARWYKQKAKAVLKVPILSDNSKQYCVVRQTGLSGF